jgi:hypothetical protein
MELYRKQLQHCFGHKECEKVAKRLNSCQVPTRLLHIGAHSDLGVELHLVELEHPAKYVALSYCWGNTQEDTKTKRSNLKARIEKVDWSQLPQTIKDAVEVTHSLGLKYLWVDVLCIIQDDVQDCAKELAKMSSVYHGATLTISAASAKHSNEGFLGNRVLSEAYGGILFRLPYHHGQGDKIVRGSVLLSCQSICDGYEEPIDSRGWTMQEHILSRRLLRFGSKQTTWKCLSEYYNIDGGASPHPYNKDPNFSIDEVHRQIEVQSRMKEDKWFGRSTVLANWEKQVEEYSCRKFTKSSDRLPACAALAENFAYIMGWSASDYLAGLWKDDIEAQLLWYRPDNSVVSHHRRIHSPTWSWATVDGPIRFHERYLLERCGHINSQTRLQDYTITRKIESLPYSEVLSGHLRLNGRLQKAYWDGICLRQSTTCFWALPMQIYWDYCTKDHQRTVWCLEIYGSHEFLGLILETRNRSYFERLGYFQVDPGNPCKLVNEWFSKVEKTTIVLH